MIFYRCNALKCFLFAYFAAKDYAIDKIMLHYEKALDIDELMANHTTVSVHKYGFFLCRTGRAKVLLGSETYEISRNHLCIYTPNTFLHIIERSAELDGILEEDDVDAYYPVVSMIDIRRRRTVQYYADEQHLSPYYFSSIIKERSGRSALQWIAGVTMTFIRQYLKCTDISIKEIADSMDFPDQSTFSRYFKRHEGCTPSEYRARLLETGG